MRKAEVIFFNSLLSAWLSVVTIAAQTPALQQENYPVKIIPPVVSDLPLAPARRREVEAAIERGDFKRAETILVAEAEREPKSIRAAKLFVTAAGIFFLDGQFLNSAIAYKKAEAITPLDERSRFTLAMAYVRLGRRYWARGELEKLTAAQPHNALYQYWLARLDYDAQQYPAAITRLQHVVELDPQMMRAFDSLGLCYDYLGRYDEAIKNFHRAVELNRRQAQPSPWPHVNLAISLMAVNQLPAAESNLREALRYDDRLPQAHYQLGQVLEKQGKYAEAVKSLTQATLLSPTFAEPHYTLGRIYQRLGDRERAKKSIERFRQLKKTHE